VIKGRLNVVIGLQWGSESKGKLAHYLGSGRGVDVVTSDFGPNAGHTVVTDTGEAYVFKMIPVCSMVPDARVLINPGSVIVPDRLIEEVETHDVVNRLKIHPHAVVVQPDHRAEEEATLGRVSSTQQGTGAAIAGRAMRKAGILAMDEPKLRPFLADTVEIMHMYLKSGAMCLAEAAQGFDLSVGHGYRYPYTTSRDVTTASVLSNAGVPPHMVGDVYGCIRTFPIRVGHQYDGKGVKVGDSGPCHEDQAEITWEDLRSMSGAGHDLTERTTVTKKMRRVFTFSNRQLRRAVRVCGPTHIFINFINHVNAEDAGVRSWAQLSQKSRDFIKDVYEVLARDSSVGYCKLPSISHIGTGPRSSDMVEKD
jgi:adenylosuccinate synthase